MPVLPLLRLLPLVLLLLSWPQVVREGAIGKCQGQLLLLQETPQGEKPTELLPRMDMLVNLSWEAAAPAQSACGRDAGAAAVGVS
jgi:hypothetical protein